MKKTLHIDEATLRDAKKACGAATDTETVRLGLEALIRHAAYERLRKTQGFRHGRDRCSEAPAYDGEGKNGGVMVLVDTSVWVRFLAVPYAAGLDRYSRTTKAAGGRNQLLNSYDLIHRVDRRAPAGFRPRRRHASLDSGRTFGQTGQ
jgi:hypothetical protein